MNEFLIKNDEKIKSAVEFSSGLMMIKQDPFETVMSYIISANNGVPQIARSLFLSLLNSLFINILDIISIIDPSIKLATTSVR